jgi:hypothetical protein
MEGQMKAAEDKRKLSERLAEAQQKNEQMRQYIEAHGVQVNLAAVVAKRVEALVEHLWSENSQTRQLFELEFEESIASLLEDAVGFIERKKLEAGGGAGKQLTIVGGQ